jgi:sortase A
VGLDPQGKMDVPKEPEDVGWYNLGAKPGENSSAVIDGHLDTLTGAPAVFYNLTKLEIGDKIVIDDELGKTRTFIVTSKEEYDFDKVPLKQVFDSPGQPTLNLITCEGVFDNANKNYSKRVVIYSRLE